jgi:hypothetical protein
MTPLEQKVLDVATPVASYLLGLAFPEVPNMVWGILFKGLEDGDIDGAAIQAFLADHGLKTYSDPSDFPLEPPQDQTPQ